MSKKENPIVTRSREALTIAAQELLEQRSAADISITEIVEAAGLSRPTFYQHFSDLGSLFAAAGLGRLEALFAALSPIHAHTRADAEEGIRASVRHTLATMSDEATFYSRVHESVGGSRFSAGAVAITVAWLRQQRIPSRHDGEDTVFWEFVAGGLVWSITRYLAELCMDPTRVDQQPDDDLAHIITAMVADVPPLSPIQ